MLHIAPFLLPSTRENIGQRVGKYRKKGQKMDIEVKKIEHKERKGNMEKEKNCRNKT